MDLQARMYSLVSLNDKNYNTWKVQVRIHLIRENLYDFIDGSETEPVTETPPSSSQEAELRKFRERRDKALASIVLAIDPKILYLVGDPQDPAVVWKTLEDTFQKKTFANKLRLKRKLYSLKLSKGESMQDHLRTFIKLFDELNIIGDPVEDEDKVILLLSSLPDVFSTFVTALEAMDSVPSWSAVTERLLHEDEKLQCSTTSANNVLISEDKNKRTCFYYKKPGHIKKLLQVLSKT